MQCRPYITITMHPYVVPSHRPESPTCSRNGWSHTRRVEAEVVPWEVIDCVITLCIDPMLMHCHSGDHVTPSLQHTMHPYVPSHRPESPTGSGNAWSHIWWVERRWKLYQRRSDWLLVNTLYWPNADVLPWVKSWYDVLATTLFTHNVKASHRPDLPTGSGTCRGNIWWVEVEVVPWEVIDCLYVLCMNPMMVYCHARDNAMPSLHHYHYAPICRALA